MDAAKSALNNYSEPDVDRFNALVSDYNNRCGSFRYRKGALEGARSDIEPYRSRIQAEGRNRFDRGSSLSTPTPSLPAPDATVQSIQLKLNELGYDAGTPDGLMGRDTRAAIIAFQQDSGAAATGVADNALLLQLRQSNSTTTIPEDENEIASPIVESTSEPGVPANAFVSGSNWYCNSGYQKVGGSCDKLDVPTNAFVSGSNWYCNSGYRKVGDRCEELDVPANAFVSGSNWYCKSGYRKVEGRCEELDVPANAFVSGSNWYCKSGYRKFGNRCEELDVPANAFVSGSNWYCKSGYRKVGDNCVSIF